MTAQALGADVIRALPKVSLHDHLDGALRPETIVELAADSGIALPATSPEALGAWFVEQSSRGSLPAYLETFAVTNAVMQTPDHLERVAREYVHDLAADNVRYGEVRWAPELHGMPLEEAVEAVQAGLEAGMQEADGAIIVEQILCAMRQNDRSLEVARLAVAWRDRGVVGFDLAGPEEGYPASAHRPALEMLAREWMPVTLHAGEAAGLESIADALLAGRALRLGHGVRIADDLRVGQSDEGVELELGALANWVRERSIPLEICPTSNLQTGATEAYATGMQGHPFDVLYQHGFNVTVSTDNRLQSGTTLTRELDLLAATFDYDAQDLLQFQLNAARAAFADLEVRLSLEQTLMFEVAALVEGQVSDDA